MGWSLPTYISTRANSAAAQLQLNLHAPRLRISGMKKMRICLPLIVVLISALGWAGQDKPSADISFTVLKDDNGKPVRNASVILHDVNEKGKAAAGGLQLKTNAEGNASYSGLPYGKILIQVIAPGFQTYGESFDINEASKTITIKLKRPQEQYSIYKDHPPQQNPPPPK
jgi:Carboxypeptidase regulatory-like domain